MWWASVKVLTLPHGWTLGTGSVQEARHKRPLTVRCHTIHMIYMNTETSRRGEPTETGSRFKAVRGWGRQNGG